MLSLIHEDVKSMQKKQQKQNLLRKIQFLKERMKLP